MHKSDGVCGGEVSRFVQPRKRRGWRGRGRPRPAAPPSPRRWPRAQARPGWPSRAQRPKPAPGESNKTMESIRTRSKHTKKADLLGVSNKIGDLCSVRFRANVVRCGPIQKGNCSTPCIEVRVGFLPESASGTCVVFWAAARVCEKSIVV